MRVDSGEFAHDGFVILRKIIPQWEYESIKKRTKAALRPATPPVEFESDLRYPGAPVDRQSPGGTTPRRLLQALDRKLGYRSLANNPTVVSAVRALLNDDRIAVSRAHHNCIMTKFPNYSSDTDWHRDYRYWAFKRPKLISAWFALQEETSDNGSLNVIPGSHALEIAAGRFDNKLFLLCDHPENRGLLDASVNLHLRPGDVLLFDCQLLHSAQRNRSAQVKLSPVFAYHAIANPPVRGTRSARLPSSPCNGLY